METEEKDELKLNVHGYPIISNETLQKVRQNCNGITDPTAFREQVRNHMPVNVFQAGINPLELLGFQSVMDEEEDVVIPEIMQVLMRSLHQQ